MPIISTFTLPDSVEAIQLPGSPDAPFFITFTTSNLPETGESWCPDVRAALPHINAAFSAETAPNMAFVEVGQRPEWKVPTNVYRTKWDVHNVPTIVRYQLVNGEIKETGRLVEGDILDKGRLQALIQP
ncbi:Thioredoxin domain-containing protein [Colletotrichum sp. SAR 10_65]|nr:Thioredoxin domain-containing protein [Colletotrichum sp. SAR 10_65]